MDLGRCIFLSLVEGPLSVCLVGEDHGPPTYTRITTWTTDTWARPSPSLRALIASLPDGLRKRCCG